jgi:hypothetical protein
MLKAYSGPATITPRSASRPRVSAGDQSSWVIPGSRRFVVGVALGVGVASFFTTELMHYLLVPDLGRYRERLLAEGLSAFILSCLIAKIANIARYQHQRTVARMQVIAEMNHHIRNALTPISLSTHITDNQQRIRVISEGVDRIDWALREILPREMPLREEERDTLGYFEHGGADNNERHKSSLR